MLDFGFYNMDCMEGMKQFPDKYFDLAIVDPPYGINVGHMMHGSVGTVVGESNRPYGGKKNGKFSRVAVSKKYHLFNDSVTPGKDYFDELRQVSKAQIIWGGNYFLDYLGASTRMIVWDKCRRDLDQADCEIAWTSLSGQSRIFTYKWNGMLQEDMKNKEFRIHPTQKPVALYKWLLNRYAKPGDIILDTHVGSASSLVACRETGHKYVGFEIDKHYFEAAGKRLQAAEQQVNIFDFMGDNKA